MSAWAQDLGGAQAVPRCTSCEPDVSTVAVSSLRPGDSPRLQGESAEHIEVLAVAAAPLPPILVHRDTMQVIDGMHRLRAAQVRGQETIEVRFFDGSKTDAFVSAVRSNTEHGLPLTLVDRRAAAARIISSHPSHSDRWIAAITGLAAGTVAAIRCRISSEDHAVTARIGQDGRIRPLRGADGRRMASDAIAQRPQASIREIAKIAGISPSTAKDVRDRMQRGEDPVPPTHRSRERRPVPAGDRRPTSDDVPSRPRMAKGDRTSLLRRLREDPSLRYTESGRILLRCLGAFDSSPHSAQDLIASVPPHCAPLLAELIRSYAEEWLQFATHLEQRVLG